MGIWAGNGAGGCVPIPGAGAGGIGGVVGGIMPGLGGSNGNGVPGMYKDWGAMVGLIPAEG